MPALLLLCLVPACGGGAGATIVSLEQAESVRDGCVAEALRMLQGLSDRIAPLARADGPAEREAVALELGCVPEGTRIWCEELGLWLEVEDRPEETAMLVLDADPRRGVHGELRLHADPERGLLLTGHLHLASADGCLAVLSFEELVALEAYGLPDGALGVFFQEGAVDLAVRDVGEAPLANGSAALSGRHALVALNFAGRRLLDEIALD